MNFMECKFYCQMCLKQYGVKVGGNSIRSFIRHMAKRHGIIHTTDGMRRFCEQYGVCASDASREE